MYIQLLVVFLAMAGAFIFSHGNRAPGQHQRGRKNYIIFVCVLFILQSALRDLTVGADTYAYYRSFQDIKYFSWDNIFQRFHDVYIQKEGKDAGYTLLLKIFQIFFTEYRVFLFAVAIFFFFFLGRTLYRNTDSIQDVLIATCIYQALFYSFFSITGTRQTIATGFILWGYQYIADRKLLKFTILILIAAFIHKSALIFYPFFFIAPLRFRRLILTAGIVFFPIMLTFGRGIATYMAKISASDAYMAYAESEYETSGARTFALFILLVGIASWIKLSALKTLPYNNYYITALALAIVFTPLTWIDPSLMRIVQYYSIFTIFLIPQLTQVYTKNMVDRQLIINIIIFVFILFIIKNNSIYSFCWDNFL